MRLLEFGRARARWRIMSLMGLVAFSAVAIWSVKTTTEFYRFRKIRAQRLSKAAVQGMFRQIMEKNPTPSPPPRLKSVDCRFDPLPQGHGGEISERCRRTMGRLESRSARASTPGRPWRYQKDELYQIASGQNRERP